MQIQLDHLNLSFQIENLSVKVEQISYGVFYNSIARHHHGRHYYELHLICGGHGTLIVDDKAYEAKAGCIFMTGPFINHEQITDLDTPMQEYCLGLEMKIDQKNQKTNLFSSLVETHFWNGNDVDDKLQQLFNTFEYESMHKNIGYKYIVQSTITNILIELIRLYQGYQIENETNMALTDHRRTLTIDNMFLTQYATITEEEMAAALNLSVRQLQRFLKLNYDKSFQQMRKEARLNMAKELLSAQYELSEIAEKVGYKDVHYFRKIFSA